MMELTSHFAKEPSGRLTKIRVSFERVVVCGVEGVSKSFVSTKIIRPTGRERQAGQFFLKYGLLRNHLSGVEMVVEKYKWLKERGFPVVPTLRYDLETNSLLMTDLTEGDRNILVDWHRNLNYYGIDRIQIVNAGEIRKTIKDIAERAFREGMALSDDNYALVLEKQEKGCRGQIYLLDLGYGAYLLPPQRFRTLGEQLLYAKIFLKQIGLGLNHDGVK